METSSTPADADGRFAHLIPAARAVGFAAAVAIVVVIGVGAAQSVATIVMTERRQ